MPVFESLSSTVQSAETIQESIGAHYTLKLIQKENKNSVSKNIQLVRQSIVIKDSAFQGKGYAKTSLFAQRLVPGLSV